MKRFFRWYWEHVKSAYCFGGYKHPFDLRGKEFWLAEWRKSKSFLIVALLPQALIVGLMALVILVFMAFNI